MGVLDGKSIIVTGAGGGIGRATCAVLAAAGARLVVSDVSVENGAETARLVKETGGEAVFVKADLVSETDVATLVEEAVDTYGRLDGAFNNAGIEHHNKPVAELDLAEWQRVIDVDLTAVFLCVKHEIRAMLRAGGGAIVNTASSLGQVGLAGAVEYCAAKHGVLGLTRAAGADYGSRGIRINAILPGITLTPMITRMSSDPALVTMFEGLRTRHSMGRFGAPQEIGEGVAWLLSDAASFVNGAAIPIDGGYLSI